MDWSKNWGLEDIWRLQHKLNSKFSFYSHVHKIHVRLDRIFCTSNLCPQFVDTEYLGRTYSDHNPLRAKLRLGRELPSIPTWRLQPAVLTDPVFKDQLETHITEYFENNDGTASNTLVEWEAFKVVTRGFCMGKTVGIRRELEKGLTKTEDQIRALEIEIVADNEKRKELEKLKSKHSDLLEGLRCHDHQRYLIRTHSEEGRAGRMLAGLCSCTTSISFMALLVCLSFFFFFLVIRRPPRSTL